MNSRQCRHNNYRKCIRCICICPQQICPPDPICTPPAMSFGAGGGQAGYAVTQGKTVKLFGVGGGGGGAGVFIQTGGTGDFSGGGGGGRGSFDLIQTTISRSGELIYTVGLGGFGGEFNQNGEDGGDTVISLIPSDGSPTIELLRATGGEGGFSNRPQGQVLPDGGAPGGGGGSGVVLGTQRVIGQGGAPFPGEEGRNAYNDGAGGEGGTGPRLPLGVTGFDFVSRIPNVGGGAGSPPTPLLPGRLLIGGGGGAGGVGVSGTEAGSVRGEDSGTNGGKGGIGWGAGGGGSVEQTVNGGKGANGVVGILFL